MKILIGGVFVVFVLLVILLTIYIWPHIWFQANGEAVDYKGETLGDTRLYLSQEKQILFRANGEDYLIQKERKEMGIPNSGNFISLPFCLYSKELDPPAVATTNRAKIERDINVVFQADSVEFTVSNGTRVKIDFTKLGS